MGGMLLITMNLDREDNSMLKIIIDKEKLGASGAKMVRLLHSRYGF
jgi:hypothetical protein